MNSWPKVSLAVIAVCLSLAILVLPSLTERLTAESIFLPVVSNRSTGAGNETPVPTLPVDPTEQATATATPTATESANKTVTVTLLASSVFSPAEVVINPGDTVVWVRAGGFHNVRADDDSFRLGEDASGKPGSTWTSVSHTFPQTGTFRYYCEIHGGPNGFDMSGIVTVQADN